MKAEHFRIQVIRDGEEKANITFPVHTVNYLSTIIPPFIKPKLQEKGLDIDQIKEEIINGGFQAQEVFSMESDGKKIKVWLE